MPDDGSCHNFCCENSDPAAEKQTFSLKHIGAAELFEKTHYFTIPMQNIRMVQFA
jgi:hypothetical protein